MSYRLTLLLRPATWGRWGRVALIAFFVWLAGRHWHPYFGFTYFLQFDPATAAVAVPALRAAPVYVHPHPGSYDGAYYAQLATDPTLRTPALRSALDDPGYRARRILVSAVAWMGAAGDPVRAMRLYSALNLVAWLALAIVLWRILPCDGWRSGIGWAGVMFATGTMVSVRLALPDLPALVLTAAALLQLERGRRFGAAGWLAVAALARETAVLGCAALLPRSGEARRQRRRAIAAVVIAVLPFAAWIGYVWITVGSSGAGLRNLSWPLVAFGRKIAAGLTAWPAGTHPWLDLTSLLCLFALAFQALYLLLHPMRDNPWWRLGAVNAGLMLCLGPAVWGDDLPGAAVRVLLPLGLAFNVLAVRARASVAWMVLGNLWVFGSVAPLWPVERPAHELTAGASRAGAFVVNTGPSWYVTEWRRSHRWAWCRGEGVLTIEWSPRDRAVRDVTLNLQGITAREVEIRQGDRVLWRDEVGTKSRTVDLHFEPTTPGRLELLVRSSAPPELVGPAPHARPLSFSVSDVVLR